ncbi:outer membrane beta-barrel protein [Hymenobacter arizonensis]|uniref:Outer membrane protein beta-barrel domain-containing protein n=1 Tax=Hymenobacter arizonensis TaxID=1227077 RepID=A0A1I5SKA6_HYMAR|nr:outer membrane beta-barrel protein [Hymenobacter arizonensis]SFP70796.1 Outer membrane protein beta-barrel domain-containing protein [Hymenobacter arizonensis]
MRLPQLALGGLLLAAALPALAQTTPETTATPRFYVGLGAYNSYYQQIGNQLLSQDGSFRMPVQLTAGYLLRPRLTLQLGVAYSGSTARYGQSTQFIGGAAGPNSSYYTLDGDYTQRQTSVSGLARYTLTANPSRRLQFDALGGFTLESRNIHSRGTQTTYITGSPTNASDFAFRRTQNTLLATGGVGVRYRVSSRFELTYDFLVSKALTGQQYEGLNNPNKDVFTGSQALGLRYRFGR